MIMSWNTWDLQETPHMQAKIHVSKICCIMALSVTEATKSVIELLLADQLEVEVTKPKCQYEVTNASNGPMEIVGQANIYI